MNNIKQVIVIRTDLNMRKGKMCAQASHASLGLILSLMTKSTLVENEKWNKYNFFTENKEPLEKWLTSGTKKIVLGIKSEIELLDLYNLAKSKSLPAYLVTDSGLTEFKGKSTNTCIAIGPEDSAKIDKLTGNLKLL